MVWQQQRRHLALFAIKAFVLMNASNRCKAIFDSLLLRMVWQHPVRHLDNSVWNGGVTEKRLHR